ncbi:hypothetical protein CPB84DRAFT_1846566 [Gymnopilus junonius]|uniref:CFEM domain-containing protein n=1 Tax=Gymnopilus junonius TaxID=109634 RepID=A0A9P5NP22_GYMJU|nr:hypothetical protein CPB84DRAFT_1846566 [Gymnopilus junonius]
MVRSLLNTSLDIPIGVGSIYGVVKHNFCGSLSASSSASATSSAQFPSLSGVSSCVSNCLADAISIVNCTSLVDVNCFCTQPNFSPELSDCVFSNCPDQIPTSESLAQQFCNVASTSVSLTFPSLPVTSATSSSTSTSSSAASTSTAPPATSSSSAVHYGMDAVYSTIIAVGMGILGVVLGAAMVQ